MELLQLRYFQALAYEQHLTRTAEKLHISQPSLSITISKLEKELGAPLFSREGRGIRLNDFGKAYLACVEEALSALEKGKAILEDMQGKSEKKVSLVLISPPIWQDMLRQFMSCYPHITVNQHALDETNYMRHVLSGDFDFYLGAPDELPAESFASSRMYQDDMVLLVPEGHPFCGRKEIRLEEAREEKFISLQEKTSLRRFIDQLFRDAGFSPKVALECDYTLRDDMVVAGYGISLTTKKSAQLVDGRGCTYVTLTDPPRKRTLALLWRKSRYLSKAARQFQAFVQSYYEHERGE